jgi:hypothetical protein
VATPCKEKPFFRLQMHDPISHKRTVVRLESIDRINTEYRAGKIHSEVAKYKISQIVQSLMEEKQIFKEQHNLPSNPSYHNIAVIWCDATKESSIDIKPPQGSHKAFRIQQRSLTESLGEGIRKYRTLKLPEVDQINSEFLKGHISRELAVEKLKKLVESLYAERRRLCPNPQWDWIAENYKIMARYLAFKYPESETDHLRCFSSRQYTVIKGEYSPLID